jgi:hypothetical protein
MRKSILVGLVLILSFTLCAVDVSVSPSSMTMKKQYVSILSAYIAHAPIYIEDSTNKSQFENLGFPGNGTMIDPYIIEGLSIDGNDTSPCIEIRNPLATSGVTGSYFVIRDCYLYNGTDGVLLWDATVGVIEYNVIVINAGSDHSWPIQIIEDYTEGPVYNITIRNNQLTKNHIYNDILIDITGPAQNVTIMNNVGYGTALFSVQQNLLFFNNTFLELVFGYSHLPTLPSNLVIANNTLGYLLMANLLYDSVVIVANNTLTDGLKIQDSKNCQLYDNDIISSHWPVLLENADNNTFTTNVLYSLDDRYPSIRVDSDSENNTIDYNFYYDYNGVDDNGDNIGDTHYFVDSDLKDYHPLMSLRGFEIGIPVTSITFPTPFTTTTSTIGTSSPTTPVSGSFQVPPFLILTIGAGGIVAVLVVIFMKKK